MISEIKSKVGKNSRVSKHKCHYFKKSRGGDGTFE